MQFAALEEKYDVPLNFNLEVRPSRPTDEQTPAQSAAHAVFELLLGLRQLVKWGAAGALALAEEALTKEAQLFLPMEGMARGAAVRKKRRRVWDIGEVLEAGGWERAGRGRDGKKEGREGGSGEGG